MGPFELIDLIGLDVNLTIARSFFAQGGEPERWRPSPIQERLVEEGKLGRKSGQGYYAYGEGVERELRSRARHPSAPTLDPEKLARIDPAAAEILPRLFAQIANEAAFALEEEIASPEDMDTAMRLGFNWPLGPLGLTAKIGAARAVECSRPWRRRRARPTGWRRACARQRPRAARRERPQAGLGGDRAAQPRRRSPPSQPAVPRTSTRRGAGSSPSFAPATVTDGNGRTVWDLESYGFLEGEAPATVNPSLWRQSRLNRIAGLFEIAPGFYQLRGFDLSNMHVVEGKEGIVVIDPLISAETAAAALALYREHRGERPVTGLIYTHSHIDHFGGAKGILTAEEVEERGIPVLAPAGFLHHAISENVFAGTAMGRRAGYMYGARLERGPDGQVGAGLGQTHRDRHGDADPAQPRRHRDRPGGDGRRRAHGLPAHPRHRGAGGDELPLS